MNTSEIIIIAAFDQNRGMGLNGDLPWHLPDDFKHFKTQTMGSPMLMGRKTLESFPKALPGRAHYVLSRDKNYTPPFEVDGLFNDLEEAIKALEHYSKLYVIGGGQIYQQALSKATTLEITRVEGIFEADTFFPEIDFKKWKLVKKTNHPKDERHATSFQIETWVKINSLTEVI
ncbi:MAG: dihydrofolate reductase [Flavobacteriaceae bacterium]